MGKYSWLPTWNRVTHGFRAVLCVRETLINENIFINRIYLLILCTYTKLQRNPLIFTYSNNYIISKLKYFTNQEFFGSTTLNDQFIMINYRTRQNVSARNQNVYNIKIKLRLANEGRKCMPGALLTGSADWSVSSIVEVYCCLDCCLFNPLRPESEWHEESMLRTQVYGI